MRKIIDSHLVFFRKQRMAEMKHIHINKYIILKPVFSFLHIFVAVVVMSVSFASGISAAGLTDGGDESELWLRMKPTDNVPHIYTHDRTPVARTAVRELQAYWREGSVQLSIDNSMPDNDGFKIEWDRNKAQTVVRAKHSAGLLYGAYELLRMQQTGSFDSLRKRAVTSGKYATVLKKGNKCKSGIVSVAASFPAFDYRLIDISGYDDSTAGGVSPGKALLEWNEVNGKMGTMSIDQKEKFAAFARASSSVGINCAIVSGADLGHVILTPYYISKVREVARTLRPYGIKTFVSVNMSSPVTVGDLNSADPYDISVKGWWEKKVKEIYTLIPDFGGIVVNYEYQGMSGPDDYHSPLVDGINMLAGVLAQYGGVVIWRSPASGNGADETYAGLLASEFKSFDGKLASNVMLQFNPVLSDLTPFEPYARIFSQIKQTPMLVELPITPENVCAGDSVRYQAPLWKDLFQIIYVDEAGRRYDESTGVSSVLVGPSRISGMSGTLSGVSDGQLSVESNTLANWYAFGRLAWNPSLTADSIADEWSRLVSAGNHTDSNKGDFYDFLP